MLYNYERWGNDVLQSIFLFFSSDSNKKCDCKRCFYQTYSNPVNAIVSFCGNSTEVFLRVNFQTAPGLMFFIIRKFILIKNTKSYKSRKLLKVVKQLEEEYDKWFLVIRHVWKNICFWNLYSEFIMYATFYESILQRDVKRIIKKHNYFLLSWLYSRPIFLCSGS